MSSTTTDVSWQQSCVDFVILIVSSLTPPTLFVNPSSQRIPFIKRNEWDTHTALVPLCVKVTILQSIKSASKLWHRLIQRQIFVEKCYPKIPNSNKVIPATLGLKPKTGVILNPTSSSILYAKMPCGWYLLQCRSQISTRLALPLHTDACWFVRCGSY